uniref:HAT C-terminal dimerisation domain-containing protein n=1 Tax=Coccolithus braarudii TaxID=221442 RepID=A0A7S0LQS7_9EUKA|mmetsp:Transcript_5380/g.11864  ORF Transcript_5380/g.11864 Transcript_5380/m.11864 type:complete len:175 (+) Transcript_5380:444-968(+)
MAVFGHRHWPRNSAFLEEYQHDNIRLLFTTFAAFFPEGVTEDDVIEQWKEIAVEIGSSEGMLSRKFHELWPDVLVHYGEDYSDILRLVAISLLIPVDTSECERVFSVMNDLKTSERNRLGANLKNLMTWHYMAKEQACTDVPVWEILHEFRLLAGIKGRYANKGQQSPQYDTQC